MYSLQSVPDTRDWKISHHCFEDERIGGVEQSERRVVGERSVQRRSRHLQLQFSLDSRSDDVRAVAQEEWFEREGRAEDLFYCAEAGWI